MSLTLSSKPGFSSLSSAAFAAGQTASSFNIAKMSQNAAFGIVRLEFFTGIYAEGDTIPLPISTVDGYRYSREELFYQWALYSTFNKDSHWITGPDSLWYAGWKVDQDTGQVFSSEYYRRSSNANPDGAQSHDGQLLVFTIAQRRMPLVQATPFGDFPELTSDATATGLLFGISTVLKINAAGLTGKFFPNSRIKFKSGSSSAISVAAASLVRTPAGDPNTITEVVPITFAGLSTKICSLSEHVTSDSILMNLQDDSDYYYVIYAAPGAGDVGANILSSPTRGSLVVDQVAGDLTSGADLGTFGDSLPSFWVCFEGIDLSKDSDFELPTDFINIPDPEFYQDRPLNQALAQAINRNAKNCVANTEVMYMGEFVDGDIVPKPISPVDGFEYDYSQVFFMLSWRWTTYENSFVQPALDLGQLDRLNAVVDSDGTVEIDVQYYPAHGGLPSHASGHGRVAVFAFCSRTNVVNGDGS